MANYYGNESDFWTSDEEDLAKHIPNESIFNTFQAIEKELFSTNFDAALDSLSWIPLISQPDDGRSMFDILEKDYDAEIDLNTIEDQLYKGILNSSDEEDDIPSLAESSPNLIDIPVDQLREGVGSLGAALKEPTLNFEVPPGLYEHINRNKDELIIPPPDENKNYIRKKWSILDNSSPVPELYDMLIEYPFELDDFQKRAIHQLTNNKHVFVSAHTSAGKTVIAEYAIALALSRGEKAIYTSPIKALSNQKYREFKKRFGAENVGIVTGDVSCNPAANCLIVTTEILRHLLYRGDSIIGQLGVVIFDEIHYINDLSRGVVWEEVIIMLPRNIQLVMLSATVPNYHEFADWIGRIMQREVVIVITNYRPTPLVHYLYIFNKMFLLIGPKGFNKDAYHNMYKYSKTIKADINKKPTFKGQVQKLQKLFKVLEASNKLPVVFFCFNRAKCEAYAKEMPNLDLIYTREERSVIHIFLKIEPANEIRHPHSYFIQKSLESLSDSDRNLPQLRSVIKLLERGIGVHHSGLLPIIKEIVEILFSRGLVKALFATETFAMGVNMPARSVVFTSIYKHDGRKYRYLTASEYTQMAGRAGRRGLDTYGSVYIFCADDPPNLQDLTNMMIEVSTKLESRFRITYNMLLQIQSREHMNITEMMLKSFGERDKMKNIPIFKRDSSKKKQELLSLPKIECVYGNPGIVDYYKLFQYSRNLATSLHESLWYSREYKQIFKCGRIIMIHSFGHSNTLSHGCILEVSSDNKEITLKVLILTQGTPDALGTEDTGVLNIREYESFIVCDLVSLRNVAFIFNNVLNVSTFDESSYPLIIDQLSSLTNSNKLELLSLNKKFKQISMQFFETVLKQRDVFHKLSLNPCTKCHLREQHYDIQCKIVKVSCDMKEYEREIEEINKNLKDESLHMYSEMMSKLEVLKQLEFLDSEGCPTIMGRIATFITTGDEITLTVALFQNVLKDLEPEECAAILSAFIYNDRSPEKETPSPTAGIQIARDKVLSIHNKIDVVQRALDVRVPYEEFNALCNFSLSYVVYQWAKGLPFHEIMELTELQEGHIVRAITRLDELCRKIVQTANIIGDRELASKIERVSSCIRRDIVFAPSLYLS